LCKTEGPLVCCRWEPSNGLPGLKDLYLNLLPRLYSVAPDALYLIEGTGQSMNKANWGDGFNTNKDQIAKWGISDPTSFLDVCPLAEYLRTHVLPLPLFMYCHSLCQCARLESSATDVFHAYDCSVFPCFSSISSGSQFKLAVALY
jgi:hypothetical protein